MNTLDECDVVRKMAGRLRSVNDNNKEQNKTDYRDKIRRHKRSAVYRVLLVLAAVAVLMAIVYAQYKNHIYTSYDTVSSVEIDTVSNAEIVRLGENILTYSSDGAHCTDAEGEVLWNQTFEMQNIMVAICGDVVAIGDYNGREIYVLNSNGKICEISTTMPIRNITVAETGRVAVAVADTKITWIQVYNPDGSLAYEGRTTMEQSGYPTAFALSPNGELLGLACTYVDSGNIISRVAFYNFGAVGANMSDYLVAADNYPDTIIPYIRFMSNGTAVAVGDDKLIFYEGEQKPVLQAQYLLDDEIQAVYQGENHIGLLFHSDKLEMKNKMKVYSVDSSEVGSYYFNLDYDNIFFTDDYFVVHNSSECLIQTFDNVNKFEGNFWNSVELMYPVGKGQSYKYILVAKDSIDTIQLR